MKQVGLIKWFDNEKGYGKIGDRNNKEVFLHISSVAFGPEKLLKGTALVFDTVATNKGISAVNASTPSTYEDFRLILLYFDEQPEVSIDITRTGKSRFGKPYERTETLFYSIVNNAVRQLLQKKTPEEGSEFFIRYFQELCANDRRKIINYFFFIKDRIKATSFVLLPEESSGEKIGNSIVDKNKQTSKNVIQQIFMYCISYALENSCESEVFDLWAGYVYSYHTTYPVYGDHSNFEDNNYQFPLELFKKNENRLNLDHYKRIVRYEGGEVLVLNILLEQLSTLTVSESDKSQEYIKFLNLFNDPNYQQKVSSCICDQLRAYILYRDLKGNERRILELFECLIKLIQPAENALTFFTEFNLKASEELIYYLWSHTRYFKPTSDFFIKHFQKLDYYDLQAAPIEFQQKLFQQELSSLGPIRNENETIQLIFLIVDTCFKPFPYLFIELSSLEKAAVWANFPNYNIRERYYSADYNDSDIPAYANEFLSNLNQTTAVSYLRVIGHVIAVQDWYHCHVEFQNNRRSYYQLTLQERNDLIKEITNTTLDNQFVSAIYRVFCRCPYDLKNKITATLFSKALLENLLTLDQVEKCIDEFYENIIERNEMFNLLTTSLNSFYLVRLWLEGRIYSVKTEHLIDEFENFEPTEQIQLFKKLFSQVARAKIDINELYIIISRIAIKTKVTFDVKLCAAVLLKLSTGETALGENLISELFCQNVNESVTELIQIGNFFEGCPGKTWKSSKLSEGANWQISIYGKVFPICNDIVKIDELEYPIDKVRRVVKIDGEIHTFKWIKGEGLNESRLYDIPYGISFCDASNSQTDEKTKIQYSWCCNSKCFKPNQTDHIFLEWRSYSLRDFIKILKLPFDNDFYYRFAGVVNRSNRLLKKLNCTSCKRLLRDSRTSEFAFYRVTTFHCTNIDCSQYNNLIYLNHCMNWKCLNVVDSRISKACSNGWYICDRCSSCCSNEKIKRRLENLITNGIYNANNSRHYKLKVQVDYQLGHLEKNEKFNYRTGEKMDSDSTL